jgi:tetratricopeptide (TPR) repeat protein
MAQDMLSPLSIFRATSLLARLALALLRRPFLASPWVWAGLTFVLLPPVPVALIVATVPDRVALLGLFALVPLTLSIRWATWRLGDSDDRVVLTAFRSLTTAGVDLALTHTWRLEQHLREVLSGHYTVAFQVIRVPVNRGQAERLLKALDAVAVVYGEVQVAGSHAAWEISMEYSDSAADTSLALARHSTIASTNALPSREARRARRYVAEPRERFPIDFEVPSEELVRHHCELSHFESAANALSVLLAERSLARGSPEAPATVILLDGVASSVPLDLASRALKLEACAKLFEDEAPEKALEWVYQQAVAGLGDKSLWLYLGDQALVGYYEKWATVGVLVDYSRDACDRYPDDYWLHFNCAMANILADNLEQADDSLRSAEQCGAPPSVVAWLRGAIAWHLRNPADALRWYQQMPRGSTRDFQMADCLRALGQREQALRTYRLALRKSPLREPAILAARAVAGYPRFVSDQLTLPAWVTKILRRSLLRSSAIVLVDWYLSRLLRRRGETPGLHGTIGHVALLRRDTYRADLLLSFAAALPGQDNTQPMLDMALLASLRGDKGAAEHYWEAAKKHREWMASMGYQPSEPELSEIIAAPLLERPGLRQLQHYRSTADRLEAIFGFQLPG